jgi:hypothetical protein
MPSYYHLVLKTLQVDLLKCRFLGEKPNCGSGGKGGRLQSSRPLQTASDGTVLVLRLVLKPAILALLWALGSVGSLTNADIGMPLVPVPLPPFAPL